MFRRWRLRKIHAKFLQSCRNLEDGRNYWQKASGMRRWILQMVTPVPLLGLHEDGEALLRALESLEDNCHQTRLTEAVIRSYHKTVFTDDPSAAGSYRKVALRMKGRNPLRLPSPETIPALMKQLHGILAQHQQQFDQSTPTRGQILSVAVTTYHQLGSIHPFIDANGRVARLSMNHILRRYGFGYVILPPLHESPPLWEAVLEAGRGNMKPLVDFADACLLRV
jgi:hypothetical protein